MGKSIWSNLSLAEQSQYVQAYKQGHNPSELLANLGNISLKTFQNYLPHYYNTLRHASPALPDIPTKIYDDYLQLELDNVLISSDWEMPYTSMLMLDLQLAVARLYGLQQLIVAGDLVANDMPGVSSHAPLVIYQPQHTFETQKYYTKEVLTTFKSQFDNIYLTYGNHENMVNRATGGQISLTNSYFDNLLEVSLYPFLWLKTSRGWAYILHPRNYARVSLSLGQKLYNTSLAPDGGKPSFVALAHTHQHSEGFSEDGHAQIVGLGTCRNPMATQYVNLNATVFPRWNASFAVFTDGYLETLKLRHTNWRKLLGLPVYNSLAKLYPEQLQ